MTDREVLCRNIGKLGWGYFFLYFNLNINNVTLFPAFVGYLLFLSAIKFLQNEEPELALLRPLGFILAAWNSVSWLCSWANIDIQITAVDLLIRLVNLYFHFQLLTNLADLAARHAQEELSGRLLTCRSIHTVMLTVLILLEYLFQGVQEWSTWVASGIAVGHVVVAVVVISAIFKLKNRLSQTTE